jgi:hypothetical protein
MKKSELRRMIQEELLNEAGSGQHSKVMDLIKQLDAEDMESVFYELSNWFKAESGDLDNMDARGIAGDIRKAYSKIKNRSGN